MSLAARLAPHLASLVHPGDADTPPFPLMLPVFQTQTLPEGMAQDMAEQAGMPTPDLALHWLEAVLHLIESVGNVELVDKAELTRLRAATREREPKRNEIKPVHCATCNTVLFRCNIRDFDTDHPRITPEVITALHSKTVDCAGHQ